MTNDVHLHDVPHDDADGNPVANEGAGVSIRGVRDANPNPTDQ